MGKIIMNGFSRAKIPINEMAEFYSLDLIDPSIIPKDRPWIYYMFVETADGRGSFLRPGKAGGYHIAQGHIRDNEELAKQYPEIAAGSLADWRLLQYGWATTDAIMAASGILNAEHNQEWRFVDDDLINYRKSLGKKPPIRVLVTGSGSIDLKEDVFSPKKEYETLIFTAQEGKEALVSKSEIVTGKLGYNPLDNAKVYVLGEGKEITDFNKMMWILRHGHGVELLDLQGGPTLAGLLAMYKLIDEYRLTTSGQIIGDISYSDSKSVIRPTAFKFPDGFELGPDNSILALPIVPDRQVGSHTYTRRKMVYRHQI